MKARRPNKKRNALLVFEFLTKEASKRLISGDNDGSNKIISIMKKAYAAGTELHKEYRLANALLVTSVSSQAVASRIMNEAKVTSQKIDDSKLNAEKTELIKQIEKYVDPTGSIYEAQLSDYKLRSTIGTLLSDWRTGSEDFAKFAQYEDQVMEHLISKRTISESGTHDEHDNMSQGERRALISIMSRKLEDRWGNSLNKDQKSLLRDYALAKEPTTLINKLNRIREEAIKCLEECKSNDPKESYFNNRLAESKKVIEDKKFDVVDDDAVSLGLLYLKLVAESKEES